MLKRNITESTTSAQMLLREEWMKRSMVSSRKLFHHLIPELEVMNHLYQMALTHLLMRVPPSTKRSITESTTRSQMSLSEEWTRRFTVSSPMLFHHSIPE